MSSTFVRNARYLAPSLFGLRSGEGSRTSSVLLVVINHDWPSNQSPTSFLPSQNGNSAWRAYIKRRRSSQGGGHGQNGSHYGFSAVAGMAAASATSIVGITPLCQGGDGSERKRGHDENLNDGGEEDCIQQQHLPKRAAPLSWARLASQHTPGASDWMELVKEVSNLCPTRKGQERGVSAMRSYTDWVLRMITWSRTKTGGQPTEEQLQGKQLLVVPTGLTLNEPAVGLASRGLPRHLATMPKVSLEFLPEFLRYCFLPDADDPGKKNWSPVCASSSCPLFLMVPALLSAIFLPVCLRIHRLILLLSPLALTTQTGYRAAKGGFMLLWTFKTKSAELHLGYKDGVVPKEVRRLLDYNGFTKVPEEASGEGEYMPIPFPCY